MNSTKSGIFDPSVLTEGVLKIDWVRIYIDYDDGKDVVTVKSNDTEEWEQINDYVARRHANHEILGLYWEFNNSELKIFYREKLQ